MSIEIERRTLLNGEIVQVHDAKDDFTFALATSDFRRALPTPDGCAIARGCAREGYYAEIYRCVAFVRYAPGHVWRFSTPERARTIQALNDIGTDISKLVKLSGQNVTLKRPPPRRTLKFLRSEARKQRDASAKKASKKYRVRGHSLGKILSLRQSA